MHLSTRAEVIDKNRARFPEKMNLKAVPMRIVGTFKLPVGPDG